MMPINKKTTDGAPRFVDERLVGIGNKLIRAGRYHGMMTKRLTMPHWHISAKQYQNAKKHVRKTCVEALADLAWIMWQRRWFKSKD